MPRRGFIPKREVLPDPVYGTVIVTKLINQIMLDGKRGVAQQVCYSAFETIAEKSGMIIELSRVITRIVVAQQREWLDQGLVPRVVSLNYSTVQLNDTQYCSYLRD